MDLSVGVHIGSTNSSVAFVHPRTHVAELIAPFEGLGSVLPSVVLLVDGKASVGDAALTGGQPYDKYARPELAVHLMRELKSMAEGALDGKVTRAVVAVPTAVEDEALVAAARSAGFAQVEVVPNPVAAILAHLGPDVKPQIVFVLVVGGQDAEAAVVQIHAEGAEVLRSATASLGGRQFDKALAPLAAGADLRTVKHELSKKETSHSGVARAAFETAINPVLAELEKLCAQTAGAWGEIDALVLAGGSSKVPALRRRIEAASGKTAARGPRAEEALALGAAIAGTSKRFQAVTAPTTGDAKAPHPLPAVTEFPGSSQPGQLVSPGDAQAAGQAPPAGDEPAGPPVHASLPGGRSTEPGDMTPLSGSPFQASPTAPLPSHASLPEVQPVSPRAESGEPQPTLAVTEFPGSPQPGQLVLHGDKHAGVQAPPTVPLPFHLGGHAEVSQDPGTLPPPGQNLVPPPSLHGAEKYSTLREVPKGCWRAQPIDPNRQVWVLPPDFTAHYFADSPYTEVLRDTDPDSPYWSWIMFVRTDGRRELFLASQQVQGEYYEIDWMPGEPQTHVNRCRDGQPIAPGFLVPLPQQPGFYLASPDIDEQISFFTVPLMRIDAESRRDRFLKILPWIRLLAWFGRLQQLDPSAYGRVPSAFKSILGQPNFEAALTHLQSEQIQGWIGKGLLPPELEQVSPQQAPVLMQSITAQQAMAPRPQPGGGGFWNSISNALSGATGPKIPAMLLHLQPQLLDQLDLMALVTMGALKSQESLLDRESKKLIARRPDLQALLKQPEGATRILQDPEFVALKSHPEVQREQADAAWRAAGQTGPSPYEQSKAIERTMAMQMMFGMAFDPGAGMFQKKAPWKIYEPFQG